MIDLSVASYISVLVLGSAESEVNLRVRAALGLAASFAVSSIGIVLAGPVFHVVDHSYPAIWAMSLLYCGGIAR